LPAQFSLSKDALLTADFRKIARRYASPETTCGVLARVVAAEIATWPDIALSRNNKVGKDNKTAHDAYDDQSENGAAIIWMCAHDKMVLIIAASYIYLSSLGPRYGGFRMPIIFSV